MLVSGKRRNKHDSNIKRNSIRLTNRIIFHMKWVWVFFLYSTLEWDFLIQSVYWRILYTIFDQITAIISQSDRYLCVIPSFQSKFILFFYLLCENIADFLRTDHDYLNSFIHQKRRPHRVAKRTTSTNEKKEIPEFDTSIIGLWWPSWPCTVMRTKAGF